jgi:hypothetical protein
MHHTELYLSVRFLIVGIAIFFSLITMERLMTAVFVL